MAGAAAALVAWGCAAACLANGLFRPPRFGGTPSLHATPAVGPDGTVYMVSGTGALYAVAPDGVPKWRRQVADPPLESPAVGPDGTVYVASADGTLHAVGADGAPKWTCHVGAPGTDHVTVGAGGTVYVASRDYHVYAVDPPGTIRWRFETGAEVHSTPAVDARGNAYFGSDDFCLYAVSAQGKQRWRHKTAGPIRTSPFVRPDGAILVHTDLNTLTVFRPQGKVEAQLPWPQTKGSMVSGPDGTLYMPGPGGLLAIRADGTVVWTYPYADRTPVVTPEGNIVAVEYTGWVRCLSPEGELLWASNGLTGGHASGGPALAPDGSVYVCDGLGLLRAIAPDGTLRWVYQMDHSALTGATFGAGGSLCVGAYDGRLYASDPEGQTQRRDRLGGRRCVGGRPGRRPAMESTALPTGGLRLSGPDA